MTIGKFYRVTGESTQHRGVEPDVPLPSPIDMKEVGESALEAALPWDRIAGVPFQASAATAADAAGRGTDLGRGRARAAAIRTTAGWCPTSPPSTRCASSTACR